MPEDIDSLVERVREALELVYREHFAAADGALADLTELAERVKAAERERDQLQRELDRVDDALAWKGTGEGRVSMTLKGKVAALQRDELVEAAEAVIDEWAREFAEFGVPEDGEVPKWQTHPYSRLRDAVAKVRGEAE